MRHGEVTLFESKAIATYMDKTFSGRKLIPEDALGAAEVEQWVSCINTAIDPLLIRSYVMAHVVPKGADDQPDRAMINRLLPALPPANPITWSTAGSRLIVVTKRVSRSLIAWNEVS